MARSPSYPQLSLEQCIELVRKVYKGAHTASIDTEAVMKEMGYAGRSGRSLAAIGSLKQFGLLEGRDDSVRVTKAALELLEPMTEAEFGVAVRDAAVRPDLFADLHREFGDRKPSEGVIRSIAIRKFGFTDTGAERLAKSYMETMAFVDKSQSEDDVKSDEIPAVIGIGQVGADLEVKSPQLGLEIGDVVPIAGTRASDTVLMFKLSASSSAQVRFSGEVTPTAIERLIRHLELSKEAFEGE